MSATNLIFSMPLLDEHGMKPQWEEVFGYFCAANIATAFVMLYAVMGKSNAYCLPRTPRNMTGDLTKPQAAFVNHFCAEEYVTQYTFISALCVILTLAIPFISNMWLTVPSVINGFRTFARARSFVEELKMTSSEVKKLMYEGVRANTEELGKLEKARQIIWEFEGSTNVWMWYMSRCGALVLFLSGTLVGGFAAYFAFFHETYFICDPEFQITPFIDFMCIYSTPGGMEPFFLICLSLVIVELTTVLVGFFVVLKARFASDQNCFTKRFQSTRTLSSFMKTFWEYSRPLKCGGFEEFLSHIVSLQYLEKCLDRAISQPGKANGEFLNFFIHSRKDAGNHIIRVILQEFRKREDISPGQHGSHHDLCLTLRQFRFPSWDENCVEFAQEVANKRYWRVFVELLECKTDETKENGRQECGVYNFDLVKGENDGNDGNTGKSILYYALHEDCRNYSAVRHILACTFTCPQVIDDNRELTAMEFVEAKKNLYADVGAIVGILHEHDERLKPNQNDQNFVDEANNNGEVSEGNPVANDGTSVCIVFCSNAAADGSFSASDKEVLIP